MKENRPITDPLRALLGFLFGLVLMLAVIRIFTISNFDFNNMRRGVSAIFHGVDPWAAKTYLENFYNPPFAILFLWPLLFTTPQIVVAFGGALLISLAFYLRAWVALSWFLTNTFLWVVGAGGIDMFVIGAGVLLLLAGDRIHHPAFGVVLRVMAYGMLLIKPQGGIFIVILYVILRRDWKGVIVALLLYGIVFPWLYPNWINALLHNPPQAQNEAAHSLLKKFGPFLASLIAFGVIFSRKWKYWQLGGALAGILAPYGMPGIPIFLTLTAVDKLIAIPMVILYSASLALLTWVKPPPGVDFYSYLSPFMSIYHLSMLGIALLLACYSSAPAETDRDTIDMAGWLRSRLPAKKIMKEE